MARAVARMQRLAAALAVVTLTATIAGCSFEERLVEGAEAERTDAPFYALPDPLPSGDPGDIERSERIDYAPDGTVAWRVLYHSRDVHGDDILVSGVVVAPDAPAPAGGRPVLSWAHPTTGAAPRCAPSVGIDPFITIEGLTDFIDRGYVVAATDYSGMGADGPDSYLIGVTEGDNVLDAARAAGDLTATNGDLVLWGHSQGGQAALFAAQLASEYAPELKLEAVAVAAPAVDLVGLLNTDIGDVSGVTIGSYAFTSFVSVYGPSTPGVTLESILTPAAAAAVPAMAELCLIGQNAALHTAAEPLIGSFLAADPGTTEPWGALLAANTPGGVRLDAPLFVAQGATDALVHPELTADFVERQRSLGTDVTFEVFEKTGHGLVAIRALPSLLDWLKDPGSGGE